MKENISYFARVPQGGDERKPGMVNENELKADLLTEGIVDQSRPALIINGNEIQSCEIEVINNALKQEHERISKLSLSVGRIYLDNEPQNTLGTGWIIYGSYMATCYHVMEKFLQSLSTIGSRCFIDFNDNDENHIRRVPIKSVFRVDRINDVAILKLDSTYNIPESLTSSVVDLNQTCDICVFGFPKAEDFRNPFSNVKFPGSPYAKRLMPGQVLERISAEKFAHDCSTSGGVSGGPIIDFNSGSVIGVHSEYLRIENMNVGIDVKEFIKLLESKRRTKK